MALEIGFFPTNKHLLLEPVQKEEKKNKKEKLGILLPEDYKDKEEVTPYNVYVVKKVSIGSVLQTMKGKKVVVENHMVQKIVVEEKVYYLIHENHVIGFFMEE